MNEKKSRALLFILGISIGLLIGATAVYLSTAPFKPSKSEVSENMIEKIVNQVYGLLSRRKDNQDSLALTTDSEKETVEELPKSSKSALKQASSNDSTNSAQVVVITNLDSVANDSIENKTLAMANTVDDIVVKKDELAEVKTVELINLDFNTSKTNAKSDSLLQAVSGVRDDSKMKDEKYNYQVELWKSPIN